MSNRQVAPTVHGEVEYETVKCHSCGETVAKESATRCVVGDFYDGREIRRRPSSGYTRIHFEHDPTIGWVCEFCRDDPARYPSGKVFDAIASTRALLTVVLFVVGAWLL